MTRDELFDKIVTYAGEDYLPEQDNFIRDLIEAAIEEVCNEMCPYGCKNREKMENVALKRYGYTIKAIAEYHYDKQGREGVKSSHENGTIIIYENSGTPRSFFRNVITISKII